MEKKKKLAIKVGSNVLTRHDGRLDVARMAALVDQIAILKQNGYDILLISSGAVASGRGELPSLNSEDVQMRQLYAAVGQAKLIEHYYDLFREYGITVGQVLTTRENFTNPELMENQHRCLSAMLEFGVIPVINENDVVSIKELMFTDNDELAGLVARMTGADLLIILSNVDGVFTGNPDDPSSELIPEIGADEDFSGCISASKSKFGRGGMVTKMGTARQVAIDGIPVVIANGKKADILTDIVLNPESARCTRFLTKEQTKRI